MIRGGDSPFLQKDRPNSTYELLVKKAVRNGRIGGAHSCHVCGMRYNNDEEARSCCEKVMQHNRR